MKVAINFNGLNLEDVQDEVDRLIAAHGPEARVEADSNWHLVKKEQECSAPSSSTSTAS